MLPVAFNKIVQFQIWLLFCVFFSNFQQVIVLLFEFGRQLRVSTNLEDELLEYFLIQLFALIIFGDILQLLHKFHLSKFNNLRLVGQVERQAN